MSGMRQKLRFTAVLVVLVIVLGTASYREQGKRQKLSFPESLDLVVVAVDGEQVTLREMAFYIAYEEGSMEDAAIIYNPDNTDEYWRLYTNHTFLREQAKQTVVDMTIHDTLFWQMATAEKIARSQRRRNSILPMISRIFGVTLPRNRERTWVSMRKRLMHPCEKWRWRRNIRVFLRRWNRSITRIIPSAARNTKNLSARRTCELDETTWVACRSAASR